MKHFLGIILLVFFSCDVVTEKKSIAEPEPWNALETELDSLFGSKFGPDEPGVAVMVVYDKNQLFAKGFGVRDLNTKEPLTASTNMEMASVSKQFTALAILSLVDQKKLSLSDTVYKFIPHETFENVTVEQLINHTSGIGDAEAYFYTHWNSDEIASNQDILDWYTLENRQIETPGTVFKYNNGAYELLPVLVERISGKKYTDFIKEDVFEKAGMNRSLAYDLNEPVEISERAFYYHKDSLGVWQQMDGHPLTGLSGAGGIYTSLNDYFKYENALRDKTIFTEATHDIIFKPSSTQVENGETSHYAMGWSVKDSLAQHGGGWFGVNTFTRMYVNKPLTLVFFANRDDFFEQENLISTTDSIVKVHLKKRGL